MLKISYHNEFNSSVIQVSIVQMITHSIYLPASQEVDPYRGEQETEYIGLQYYSA